MSRPKIFDLIKRVKTLEDKNIITAQLASNYTLQADNTAEELKNFVEYNKIGNKLSIENGCIKIGSGVSKVKVSYTAMTRAAASTDRVFTYLRHNSANLTQESNYFQSMYQQISVGHAPMIVDVEEGDIFYIATYGGAGNQVYGGSFCWTSITVEVIE